jgi:hypothetical protein
VAHRSNYRKTIIRVGHVQVPDQDVEALGSDRFEGFRHASGLEHVKSLAYKFPAHHVMNGSIVIEQKQSMRNAAFGLRHLTSPFIV